MSQQIVQRVLFILVAVPLLTAACSLGRQDSPEVDGKLESTLSSQGTRLANLATNDAAQWEAISALSTRMPLAQGLVTPMPPDSSPTSYPMCTPPACAPDEMYYCPGECPGGCGTTCATATPGVSSGTGQVWGEVCYPSDIRPPITLYFQDIRTREIIYHELGKGETPYRVELPGGVYIAFAWSKDRYFAIAYTEYTRCGGGEHCTDHSLVPFLVRPGNVTTGVDICDREVDVDGLPPLQ